MKKCKNCGGKYESGTWRDKYGKFCSTACEFPVPDTMTKVGARALLDKIEAFWLLHHKKHFEGRLEKQTLGGRLYWYVRFDGKDHPALT